MDTQKAQVWQMQRKMIMMIKKWNDDKNIDKWNEKYRIEIGNREEIERRKKSKSESGEKLEQIVQLVQKSCSRKQEFSLMGSNVQCFSSSGFNLQESFFSAKSLNLRDKPQQDKISPGTNRRRRIYTNLFKTPGQATARERQNLH